MKILYIGGGLHVHSCWVCGAWVPEEPCGCELPEVRTLIRYCNPCYQALEEDYAYLQDGPLEQ